MRRWLRVLWAIPLVIIGTILYLAIVVAILLIAFPLELLRGWKIVPRPRATLPALWDR
jgi:uncharacterized membrane protein